jgi:hypothetical protein
MRVFFEVATCLALLIATAYAMDVGNARGAAIFGIALGLLFGQLEDDFLGRR